jgi:hypothetical protein
MLVLCIVVAHVLCTFLEPVLVRSGIVTIGSTFAYEWDSWDSRDPPSRLLRECMRYWMCAGGSLHSGSNFVHSLVECAAMSTNTHTFLSQEEVLQLRVDAWREEHDKLIRENS